MAEFNFPDLAAAMRAAGGTGADLPQHYKVHTANWWANLRTALNSADSISNIVPADFADGIYPVFNVKDPAYGALGNNVNDDSAAIQAALNAAEALGARAVLYFPSGTYRLNSKVLHADYTGWLTIRGDGPRVSILQSYNSDGCLDITFGAVSYVCSVSGITFLGAQSAAGTCLRLAWPAISSNSIINLWVSHCSFAPRTTGNYYDIGMHIVNAWEARISQCGWVGGSGLLTGYGVKADGVCVGLTISDCFLQSMDRGIFVGNSDAVGGSEGVIMWGLVIVATRIGVEIDYGPTVGEPHVSISNSHMACDDRCILLDNASQAFVFDNNFYCGSNAGTGATHIDVELTNTLGSVEVVHIHDNMCGVHLAGNTTDTFLKASVSGSGTAINRLKCHNNTVTSRWLGFDIGTNVNAWELLDNDVTKNNGSAAAHYSISTVGVGRVRRTWDLVPVTLTANDATPSLHGPAGTSMSIYHMRLQNAGATTITTFDDGVRGDEILVEHMNGNTTIAETGNIILQSGATAGATTGIRHRFYYDGTNWLETMRTGA